MQKIIMKKCDNCGAENIEVKDITIKVNGVLSYYDVERTYCKNCVRIHNRELLEGWG